MRLQSPVAIKEFFPAGCSRQGMNVAPGGRWNPEDFNLALAAFLREGQILERFNHAGIVRVYAVFEEHATAYMVMEYLKGESLAQGMARRGAMNEPQALEVAKSLGSALEAVHLAGLLHSDLKPENILRIADGRLVLLDFGTSRGYLSAPTKSEKQMQAVTPGYSPPEQYQRRATLTPRSDVYALAATIYSLLALRIPVPAHERARGVELPPLRQINSSVSEITQWAIEQGMQMEPDKRPASVAAFLELLTGETVKTINKGSASVGGLHGRELACLTGHSGWVMGLDISPDGSMLTSCSRDGTIRLWSLPEGKLLGVLPRQRNAVNCVRISPDGKIFATGTQDGTLTVWELASGQEVATLKTGAPPVQDLRFSADGNFIVTALTDGTVRVYGRPGQPARALEGHQGPVNSVDCACDGRLAASGSNDRTIRLWDLATGRQVRTLVGHERMVQSVKFSPDGMVLASGSNDLTVRLWDVVSGSELRRLKGHGALVWCVNFAPQPNYLITGSGDRSVRVFRVDSAREVLRLEGHTSWVRTVACVPNRPVIATGGGDNSIRLWELRG